MNTKHDVCTALFDNLRDLACAASALGEHELVDRLWDMTDVVLEGVDLDAEFSALWGDTE
jgi:hypothetical protein